MFMHLERNDYEQAVERGGKTGIIFQMGRKLVKQDRERREAHFRFVEQPLSLEIYDICARCRV